MSSSTVASGAGAKFDWPSVDGDEGKGAEDEQDGGSLVGGGVVEVFNLVEEDDGESAGGSGDVSTEHEDDAEFTEGVEEGEDAGGEERPAGEGNQEGADESAGSCTKQASSFQQVEVDGGESADKGLDGEGEAVDHGAYDESREGEREWVAEEGGEGAADSGAGSQEDEQVEAEDGWGENERKACEGFDEGAEGGARKGEPGGKRDGDAEEDRGGERGEF